MKKAVTLLAHVVTELRLTRAEHTQRYKEHTERQTRDMHQIADHMQKSREALEKGMDDKEDWQQGDEDDD
jgi:hypothetical protein